jgi:hypothetical protein
MHPPWTHHTVVFVVFSLFQFDISHFHWIPCFFAYPPSLVGNTVQLLIAEHAGIERVHYALPNKHYILVDMPYLPSDSVDNLTPCVSHPSAFALLFVLPSPLRCFAHHSPVCSFALSSRPFFLLHTPFPFFFIHGVLTLPAPPFRSRCTDGCCPWAPGAPPSGALHSTFIRVCVHMGGSHARPSNSQLPNTRSTCTYYG